MFTKTLIEMTLRTFLLTYIDKNFLLIVINLNSSIAIDPSLPNKIPYFPISSKSIITDLKDLKDENKKIFEFEPF